MMRFIYIPLLIVIGFTSSKAQELSVKFSKTETMCELAKAEISIISGAQPINILWSNGSIMNSIDQLPVGTYSVEITDNLMRDTVIAFNIEEIICEPSPEGHFTPNADGYNDTWSIGRIEHFPEYELYVYNRWGQLVHHQLNQYIPWDGKSLGLPLPDATYYYILYLSKSDKKKLVKGDITIIR